MSLVLCALVVGVLVFVLAILRGAFNVIAAVSAIMMLVVFILGIMTWTPGSTVSLSTTCVLIACLAHSLLLAVVCKYLQKP